MQMEHAPYYDAQLHDMFSLLPSLVARECEHIIAVLSLLDLYVVRGGGAWFSACSGVVASLIGEVSSALLYTVPLCREAICCTLAISLIVLARARFLCLRSFSFLSSL